MGCRLKFNDLFTVEDFIVRDLQHIFISGEEFNGLIMILLLVPALILSSFKDRKLNIISIFLLCCSVGSGLTMLFIHIFADYMAMAKTEEELEALLLKDK